MASHSNQSNSGPIRTTFRWLLGLVCFGFAPALMLWAWQTEHYARSWTYWVAPILGAVLIAHWYLFCGRQPFMTRLRRFAIFAGVVGLLGMLAAGLLRYEGSAGGSSLPKLVWRWAPSAKSAAAAEEQVMTAKADAAATAEGPVGVVDSTQFLGSGRNGNVTTTASLDWAAKAPEELWRRPIGLGWSGFAVAGGRAVTQEQRGEDEWVSCYELSSGKLLWKHSDAANFVEKMSGPGPRSTPTIVDRRVWTLGATGILNCLDLDTGECLWSRQVLTETGSENLEWGKSTSPLWVDGKVVVSGGNHRATLVAFDAETGATLWTYDGDGSAYSSPTIAEIGGVRQIVSVNRVDVSGNDLETGEELWRWKWPGVYPKVGQPVPIGENRVLVTASYGAGSHLLQVDQKEGGWSVSHLWESSRLKTKFSSASVIDGFAYGLHEGIFACIDLSDGSKVWKGGRYGFGQHLLVNGDTFLVQAERGKVVLVAATPEEHREVGELAALAESGGTSWNPPTLAGRYLLLRNDREAVCYRLAE